MSTPDLAVQDAIVTALRADGTVAGLVTGIYDDVPSATTALPYITIGDTFETQTGRTKNRRRWEESVTLHVWSTAEGKWQVKTIMAAIDGALDTVALAVSGYTLERIESELNHTTRDPDGETFHGIARYLVQVHA